MESTSHILHSHLPLSLHMSALPSPPFDVPFCFFFSCGISAYPRSSFQNHCFVVSKFVTNLYLVFSKCLDGISLLASSFVNFHRYKMSTGSFSSILNSDSKSEDAWNISGIKKWFGNINLLTSKPSSNTRK